MLNQLRGLFQSRPDSETEPLLPDNKFVSNQANVAVRVAPNHEAKESPRVSQVVLNLKSEIALLKEGLVKSPGAKALVDALKIKETSLDDLQFYLDERAYSKEDTYSIALSKAKEYLTWSVSKVIPHL